MTTRHVAAAAAVAAVAMGATMAASKLGCRRRRHHGRHHEYSRALSMQIACSHPSCSCPSAAALLQLQLRHQHVENVCVLARFASRSSIFTRSPASFFLPATLHIRQPHIRQPTRAESARGQATLGRDAFDALWRSLVRPLCVAPAALAGDGRSSGRDHRSSC